MGYSNLGGRLGEWRKDNTVTPRTIDFRNYGRLEVAMKGDNPVGIFERQRGVSGFYEIKDPAFFEVVGRKVGGKGAERGWWVVIQHDSWLANSSGAYGLEVFNTLYTTTPRSGNSGGGPVETQGGPEYPNGQREL